jgi:hypothetical protein
MRTQKKIISETTPLQIICVIAWLWVVPVIDSLDSYTYGMATRAILTSFIAFALGIIVARNMPKVATLKRGRCALVIGIVVLLLFLVFWVPLFQRLGHWYTRNCALFRASGFLLLGFGLSITEVLRKTPTFKTGVAVLLGLYIIYNLLLWGSHNPHPDRMPLYYLAHMLLALVRIAIIVALWKTLSAGSVMEFCNRYRKCSSLFAGLFWGMFLVMPVGSYASGGIAVLMLFLAPIFAYIMTVAVRFLVRLTMYVVKGVLANRFWWLESCRWWLDKEDNSENLEK